MKPRDVILKVIYDTLKRRKVKFLKWQHNGSHILYEMRVYIEHTRKVKKCHKCVAITTKPTDVYIDDYTLFWASEESPLEYKLGFQKRKQNGPLQPLELWTHEVHVDLSNPRSFQKIIEFMTPHLPKLRKKENHG